jgi:hypothetical protein
MVAAALLATGMLSAVTAGPAAANGACPANKLCLYQCWLSQSCGYTVAFNFTLAGCNNIESGVPFTKSVKNTTGNKYFVYQSNNCTGAHGIIYPNSTGDMNAANQYFHSLQRTVI